MTLSITDIASVIVEWTWCRDRQIPKIKKNQILEENLSWYHFIHHKSQPTMSDLWLTKRFWDRSSPSSLHFLSQYHSANAPYSFMHLPLTLDHFSNWVHHSTEHLKKVLNQSRISVGYTFVQNFWISLILKWWTSGFWFWRFHCSGWLFLL